MNASQQPSNRTRLVVGLTGPSGAGKSCVAAAAAAAIGCTLVIQYDWYYRDLSHMPLEERHRVNFDRPEALEGDLLAAHLRSLREGRPVCAPCYDYVEHIRLPETRLIEPQPVVIVDGLFTLADAAVRDEIDLAVYIDAPEDLRLERRIARDIAERGWTEERVRCDWQDIILPAERAIIRPCLQWAHFTIENAGDLQSAVESLCEVVRSSLDVRSLD